MTITADLELLSDPAVWTRGDLIAEIHSLQAQLENKDRLLRIIQTVASEGLSGDVAAALPPPA